MNIKKSILGWLAILLPMAIWTQNSSEVHRVAYYADLPFWESPYIPFKGACPITAEEAAQRIHLKLDFDSVNRIVAVHVRLGQHYKAFEGFFGNLYINAPLTKVLYKDNLELHEFYDRFGNQTTVQGNIHQKVYEKEEHGRNIRLSFLDPKGLPTSDMFGVQEYLWSHQQDGGIIEERLDKEGNIVPLRGEFELGRTKMYFDDQGYFGLLQNVDEQGKNTNTEKGIAQFLYYYDKQGRFVRWEVYDENGQRTTGPSHTSGEQNTFYQYDLENIIFFDAEGNPATHWSGAQQWHFKVDQFGNRVLLEFQDTNGQPMNANNNYAKRLWEWSKDGRFLLSEVYLDQNGKPVEHKRTGIYKITYIRDDEGRIVDTRVFNRNNELIPQDE